MPAETRQTVRLDQVRDYQFDVHFGAGIAPLRTDEPAPIGAGQGPSPVQQLAAAVGNCLGASLLFALRKYKQQPEPIAVAVSATVGRNPEGRQRVLGLDATLTLGRPAAALEHLDRVLAQFEEFCTVTQSVRAAIPVTVHVVDAQGLTLK